MKTLNLFELDPRLIHVITRIIPELHNIKIEYTVSKTTAILVDVTYTFLGDMETEYSIEEFNTNSTTRDKLNLVTSIFIYYIGIQFANFP